MFSLQINLMAFLLPLLLVSAIAFLEYKLNSILKRKSKELGCLTMTWPLFLVTYYLSEQLLKSGHKLTYVYLCLFIVDLSGVIYYILDKFTKEDEPKSILGFKMRKLTNPTIKGLYKFIFDPVPSIESVSAINLNVKSNN